MPPTLRQGDSLGSSQMLRKPVEPPSDPNSLAPQADAPCGEERISTKQIFLSPHHPRLMTPLCSHLCEHTCPNRHWATPSRNQDVPGVVSTSPDLPNEEK